MASRGHITCILAASLAVGCAASEPIIDVPPATGGNGVASGGDRGAGGTASGGAVGSGGGPTASGGSGGRSSGGATGTGGGVVPGTGGATASGGRGGSAGTGGRLGLGGGGGRLGAGGAGGRTATGGSVGTGGTPPAGDGGVGTFTAVYADVISKYCFGSACHNPAGSGRPSFATQPTCYSYFKSQGQLYPGQTPSKSYIYFIMSGDPTATPPSPPYMPPAPNANVSASDLAIVAAWIAEGALNN
jgi:hypothetical protein